MYDQLENNLKQGLASPWGIELVTFWVLKESSYKFSKAYAPNQWTIYEVLLCRLELGKVEAPKSGKDLFPYSFKDN